MIVVTMAVTITVTTTVIATVTTSVHISSDRYFFAIRCE